MFTSAAVDGSRLAGPALLVGGDGGLNLGDGGAGVPGLVDLPGLKMDIYVDRFIDKKIYSYIDKYKDRLMKR